MKKLLTLCLLALGLRATAQVSPLPVIPIDSASQKVMYEGVMTVPGAGPDELYSRAREWFATYFNSGKAVLDMDDRAAGKLIGGGFSTFYITMLLVPGQYELWRTLKVYTREGRYRYEITDLRVSGPHNNNLVTADQANAKTPLENFLGEPARRNSYLWDKKGQPKTYTRTVMLETDKAIRADVAALAKAMATPAGKKAW